MIKRLLRLLIKACISLGLIWLVLSQIDGARLLHHLAELSLWAFAFAVLLLVLQAPILAQRWLSILAIIGPHLGFAQCFRIAYLGLFFNQVLPTSVGGDVVRMLEGRRVGLTPRIAVNSVIIERVSGLLMLVILTTLALPMIWSRLESELLRIILTALPVLACVGFAGLYILDRLPFGLSSLPILRSIATLATDLRLVTVNTKASLVLLLLGLVSHLLAVGAAFVLGRNLGLEVTPILYLALIPAALLASVVPISIAGWGVREGAMVVLFTGVGESAEAALALSLLFGVALILAALPGGLYLLMDRPHHRDVGQMTD